MNIIFFHIFDNLMEEKLPQRRRKKKDEESFNHFCKAPH